MPTFNYKALDKAGRVQRDSLHAESEGNARRLLKDRGLVVLTLSKARAGLKLGRLPALGRARLDNLTLAMLLRQLSTLIASGLPIDETLGLMASQCDDPKQKRLLQGWLGSVAEGNALSEAMATHQPGVPDSIVAALAVAEETGHLDRVLDRLASDQEHALSTRQTLKGALIYPAMLIIAASAALSFIMVNVVPKITAVFMRQKTELPPVTKAVIAVSHFLSDYGPALLLLLLGSLLAGLLLLQDASRRRRFHARLLAMPRLGPWLMMAALADWCRSLALLLVSQVPAVDAMQIANAGVANLELRARLNQATQRVREGESMHAALTEQAGLPGFLLHLVGSGEASSELASMLQRVADYYAAKLKSSTDTALKLVNPLLLVLIAGVIMVIILGVLTPIMQLNQMV